MKKLLDYELIKAFNSEQMQEIFDRIDAIADENYSDYVTIKLVMRISDNVVAFDFDYKNNEVSVRLQ